MIIKNEIVSKGFILAGIMNIAGVLVSSRCFTNDVIPLVDAVVMSNFGLVMIIIWGLAYIAVSKGYSNVQWLVGVFVIEKFVYGFIWTKWILNNNISDVFEKDKAAGLFYATYGINDWIFFLFFLIVFIQLKFLKK